MKYFNLFFFATILSCSPFLNKEKNVEFSVVEGKVLFSKMESVLFDKESAKISKFSDSCRNNRLNCYYDNETFPATFPGGMNRFTTEFYDNFRIKKSTKPSDIKVRMIIGKQNNIQHAEISGFKDEKMKSEIKRVLKLPNLNKWHSANTILGKSDYEIIFLIKIK